MWGGLYYRDGVQSQALPMAVLYLWVPKHHWTSWTTEIYHIVVFWLMAPSSLAGGISSSLETEQYAVHTEATTAVRTGGRILWRHTLQPSAVFLRFLKRKLIFATLSFISWQLICSNLNTLRRNVNKIVVRITTLMMVFVTVSGIFVLLTVTKFRENWSLSMKRGGEGRISRFQGSN